MRFSKIPLGGCVRAWVRKIEIFAKNWGFAKLVEIMKFWVAYVKMTRRASLSSKSNTGAGGIEIKHASQKMV